MYYRKVEGEAKMIKGGKERVKEGIIPFLFNNVDNL
jgi:hypothetical protein